MSHITNRQGEVLRIVREHDVLSAARIRQAYGDISLATIKRDIAALVARGYVTPTGKGRNAGYKVTIHGELFAPVDAHAYCAQAPDARGGFERYDDTLLPALPETLFSVEEIAEYDAATKTFRARSAALSGIIAEKELERFVIELSWKSSRIEGNTYTLLDTERLIRDGVEASGHSHEEAAMILNHKSAFTFARAHREEFAAAPTRAAIEEIHRLLTEGLAVGRGVRRQLIGIVGTRYRPLENQFQIGEAMDALRAAIGRASEPYTAALIALAGVSYLQPFEDGNKRTARMLTNALLMARGRAPLSYRSADEIAYREAILVFYETHSLMPLKDIFKAQYLFAAEQYGIA